MDKKISIQLTLFSIIFLSIFLLDYKIILIKWRQHMEILHQIGNTKYLYEELKCWILDIYLRVLQ